MIEEYACKFPPVELHIRLDWRRLMCCSFPTVSFSYPNTSTEEVAMNMSRTGSKKGSTTFTSNASEVTPDQMRYSLTVLPWMLIFLHEHAVCKPFKML